MFCVRILEIVGSEEPTANKTTTTINPRTGGMLSRNPAIASPFGSRYMPNPLTNNAGTHRTPHVR